MKITILTFYTKEFQPLADLTVPNKDKFCKIAGYTHVVKVGPYADANAYYAVDRMIYLRDYLFSQKNDIELVWVLGLNTFITNFNKRLEEFITPEHDFFIPNDCHGLNTGSFVVRKSEWSKKWLNFIIEKSATINHPWHEQRVVHEYADQEGWKEKIKILPQNSINSYDYRLYGMPSTTEGQFKKGDFVFHAPGQVFWDTGTLLESRLKLFSGGWLKENTVEEGFSSHVDQSVAAFYEKEADHNYFKKYNDEHRARFDFLFKEFKLEEVKGFRVGDFGGGYSELLSRLDPSNEKHCFDGARIQDALPFAYHFADLNQKLDWPDRYFDLSIASEVLEHLASPYTAVEEMKRVTRIGGRILITVPDIRMTHNSPYFPLFYPHENFEAWLDQMALPRIHTALFNGNWPSRCYLCENRPWAEKKLPFPKSEEKFKNATPLEATNI